MGALSNENSGPIVAQGTLSILATVLNHPQLKKRFVQTMSLDAEGAAIVRTSYTKVTEQTSRLFYKFQSSEDLLDACSPFCASLDLCLPTNEFIRCLQPLFLHRENHVRYHVLKNLQHRIEKAKPSERAVQDACFESLRHLISVLGSGAEPVVELSAVMCINGIAEKYGRANPSEFPHTPEALFEHKCFDLGDPRLCAAALICLTTLVDVLREEFLPFVPLALSTSFSLLEANARSDQPEVGLHNAIYSFFQALLIYIPWMMSGDHLDRLLVLSQMSLSPDLDARSRSNRTEILELIAKEVSPSECFSALSRTLRSATQHGLDATKQQIGLVQVAIERHSKSVTVSNSQEVMTIFLEALDTRRLHSQNPPELKYSDSNDLIALESEVYNVMIKMVYKLNDTHFRPLFIRGCEWSESHGVTKDKQIQSLRAVAWYGFLESFFGTLQSIVTGYVTYVIDSTADLLRKPDYSDPVWRTLLSRVVATLRASYEHDQDDFWHAHDHFEAILDPLLSQLPLAAARPFAHLLDPLIACITAFATASGSQEHHRKINMAVLPHLRADDVAVRLAAARCQVSLTKALGEEWLAMLPEMLPFIAEALEDDDEKVENAVRGWVRDIEERTGESLDGMLQ